MTITTWTLTKGIPPRQHKPKGKGKPHGKKVSVTKKGQKRGAVEEESDNDDDSPESESDDPKPKAKKWHAKWRHTKEAEEEAKVIEDNVNAPEEEVVDVDDGGSNGETSDEEVSKL